MDVNKLKRDSKVIQNAIREVQDALLVVKPIKVYVPERYKALNLLNIDEEITLLGIHGIVDEEEKHYALNTAMAMCHTEPSKMYTEMVGTHGKYYVLEYQPGSKLMTSINLITNKLIAYRLYNELISKAAIPWYMTLEDIPRIYTTAKYHADANLTVDNAVLEMMLSSISRDSKDKTLFYRHLSKDPKYFKTVDPYIIPLKMVALTTTNTFTKLAGSYFNEALSSSLITKSKEAENIELLLRA